MIGLIRAEWKKAVGNHLLIAFLVWIFPVGITTFYIITLLVSLVSESAATAMADTSSGQWTTDMMGVWSFVLAFPTNVIGRLLPLAFMSVLFAGEYEWGTWRFVLPRTPREPVVLAKAGTSAFIVLLSFVVASLIVGVGQTVTHRVMDIDYGPPLTGEALLDFAGVYAWHALLGTLSLLILAGFATLGALFTRSILGALLVGLGLAVLEPMSRVILIAASRILNLPNITNLYQFAATYHLDNARSWILFDRALPEPIHGFTAEWSLGGSLAILVIWVIGLMVSSIVIFRRQDITS
jgi:ABC-type transport system involved in multi-copper enzyme maturation permease subunit